MPGLPAVKDLQPFLMVVVGGLTTYLTVDRHQNGLKERAQLLQEQEFAQQVLESEREAYTGLVREYLALSPDDYLRREAILGYLTTLTDDPEREAWAVAQLSSVTTKVAAIERERISARVEAEKARAQAAIARKKLASANDRPAERAAAAQELEASEAAVKKADQRVEAADDRARDLIRLARGASHAAPPQKLEPDRPNDRPSVAPDRPGAAIDVPPVLAP